MIITPLIAFSLKNRWENPSKKVPSTNVDTFVIHYINRKMSSGLWTDITIPVVKRIPHKSVSLLVYYVPENHVQDKISALSGDIKQTVASHLSWYIYSTSGVFRLSDGAFFRLDHSSGNLSQSILWIRDEGLTRNRIVIVIFLIVFTFRRPRFLPYSKVF